jgi:hypothetical protein
MAAASMTTAIGKQSTHKNIIANPSQTRRFWSRAGRRAGPAITFTAGNWSQHGPSGMIGLL